MSYVATLMSYVATLMSYVATLMSYFAVWQRRQQPSSRKKLPLFD
jgi:amino acid transporter